MVDKAKPNSPPSNPTAIICYGIPGLGATGEIFEKLTLPPGMEMRSIKWEDERKGESLGEYAQRLLPQIDQNQPFILVGFSFGAVIAVELAKLCKPVSVVIISGVVRGSEIPFYLKYLRAFHAYKLAPVVDHIWLPLIRLGCRISFGTHDPHALDILVHMILKQDPSFYIWGLETMMDWKNEWVPSPMLQFHGSADRLLPARYVSPDVFIKGGGHFILYTHGRQIGEMIGQSLDEILQLPTDKTVPGQAV